MGNEVIEGGGGATTREVGIGGGVAEDSGDKGVAAVAIHRTRVAELVDTSGDEGGFVFGLRIVPWVVTTLWPRKEKSGLIDGADIGGGVGTGGGERKGGIVNGGTDGKLAADLDVVFFSVHF